MNRLALTSTPWIKNLLTSRWPQFIVRTITLAGFLLTILAGLFGSRVGSHNFAIIFVWIAWWSLLKLVFIPAGGRSWCSICPIPMPGEWLQNGGLLGPGGRPLGLGKRWPRKLNNTWLQSAVFLGMGIFSAVILTQPRISGWALLGLFIAAITLSLVFERRSFCRYLCPIGGFTGLYAQLSPVEIRAVDPVVCAGHTEKTCYTGSAQGYGCPWGNFPAALSQDSNCGLCMECLRTCPHDNLAFNLRPYGSEISAKTPLKLDETFLALVMLGSALVYTAVYMGSWGWLKNAAYHVGTLPWLAYALAFLAITLVVVPGLFFGAVWLGKKMSAAREPLKKLAGLYGSGLLPLGMATWVAFTVSFAFAKISYILPVLSDPFGWGWDLFGTASTNLSLVDLWLSPIAQVGVLAGGLLWSSRLVMRLARDRRQALPVLAFALAHAAGMMWLLVG